MWIDFKWIKRNEIVKILKLIIEPNNIVISFLNRFTRSRFTSWCNFKYLGKISFSL